MFDNEFPCGKKDPLTAHYFIGVDGGGTHTRAVAADQTGRIVGVGRAGSTNRNHHSRDEVRTHMRSALVNAVGDHALDATSVIFLGMCGVSTDADRQDIVAIVREIPEVGTGPRVVVENDTRIGLAGGLSGRPGIALIAGTGSACFGMNGAGRTYLSGGWGALADDVGSGPWIGLRAIQAAVQSEDGRLGPTLLRDIVFNFLGLTDPRELIDRVHNRGLQRAEIGELAPRVIEAYRAGDAVAGGILHAAAAELARLVAATAGTLFGEKPCEMILVGGLALSGPPFQNMLVERIARDIPNVAVRDPEMSPVQGAVLEAVRAAGIAMTPQLLGNLRSSAL
jgi:glucosamine kinase